MVKHPVILICDDDPVVHESIGLYVKSEGFEYISAYNGEQALEKFKLANPDIIILDIMMPMLDGIDVCRKIRQESGIPIIMLTGKGEEEDRIFGLELGADDYIVKPFSPRELLSRIKVIIRRSSGPLNFDDKNIIRLPQLEISLKNYQVRISGKAIPFTPKEVEIIHLLTLNAGKVFSREEILSKIWGYDYFGDTRIVDAHIKRIRQKLPQDGVPWQLATVYGIGYRFEIK